jgi:hypothetical protein
MLPPPSKPKVRKSPRRVLDPDPDPAPTVAAVAPEIAQVVAEPVELPRIPPSVASPPLAEPPVAPVLVMLNPEVLVGLVVSAAFLGALGYDTLRKAVERLQALFE